MSKRTTNGTTAPPDGELVPTTTRAPAETLPDWLRGEAGAGLEEADESDLRLPMLRLMQALSPEVQDGAARPGDIVNGLTRQVYGRQLVIVPVKHSKQRVLFPPRGAVERAPRCRAPDGKTPVAGGEGGPTCAECRFAAWRDREPPECTQYYLFASLVEGSAEPVALSMASSNLKIAKGLISMAKYGPAARLPLYGWRYQLSTTEEQNQKGRYYVYRVLPLGPVTDRALYDRAKALYDSMHRYVIEPEAPREDAAPTAAPGQEW